MTGWKNRTWIVPAGAAATYVLLGMAVHLRLLDGVDVAVAKAARPDDVWGPVQVHAARVVTALQPTQLVGPLVLGVAATSLMRRSVRPAVMTAVIVVPAVVLTFASKWLMAHWDATATPVPHGGFPSGHTVFAVTGAGVAALLLRPRPRWIWMLPVAIGVVIDTALVLASVHPATDVLGADLLAAGVLASAAVAGLGRWVHGSSRGGV